ncbi:MAG: peptidylprolyl isomerase [Acidobacteria bacterium]|nr:peptidylprolyl isomerase [Acidobacteriota bacterium]
MTAVRMAGHCVTLDTEAGAIVVELLAEAAPETARNFLNLAATGALDTTTFSRVVKGFVVQGGNITTRERVTPELLRRAARKVPDEPNAVKHLRGVVSLARPAEANSATTHFFILLNDAAHLDGNFAAFGRVTSGMDVVDRVAAGELDGEKPKSPVRIRRAAVARCVPPPDENSRAVKVHGARVRSNKRRTRPGAAEGRAGCASADYPSESLQTPGRDGAGQSRHRGTHPLATAREWSSSARRRA